MADAESSGWIGVERRDRAAKMFERGDRVPSNGTSAENRYVPVSDTNVGEQVFNGSTACLGDPRRLKLLLYFRIRQRRHRLREHALFGKLVNNPRSTRGLF